MLKDLYTIQLYKIYYKNIHNILPVYFQRFLPNYNNGSAHNHNLRHQALRLPMTRKEYYVQSTKYQLFFLEKMIVKNQQKTHTKKKQQHTMPNNC